MTFLPFSLGDFFQFQFLQFAAGATFILALTSGLMSPFLVAKRYGFLGEGISHASLLSLSLSMAIFSSSDPLLVFFGTLVFTQVSALLLGHATWKERTPNDALIGIFLATSLALAVLIHSVFVKEKADLMSFLFGNIFLVENQDLLLSLIFGLSILLIILINLKKWIFITFDPKVAQVMGIPTKFYHFLFISLTSLLIVCSIKISGTILINSLLIMPGVLGLKFGRGMKQVFTISLIFSLSSLAIGLMLANWQGLPPGATLALTQFIIFLGIHITYKFKRIA